MTEKQIQFPDWGGSPRPDSGSRVAVVHARQIVCGMVIDALGGTSTISGNRDGAAMLFGVPCRHQGYNPTSAKWQEAFTDLSPSQHGETMAEVRDHAVAILERINLVPLKIVVGLRALGACGGGQLSVVEAAIPHDPLSSAEEEAEVWRILWAILAEALGGRSTKSGIRDGGAALGGLPCQHYDDMPKWTNWRDALSLIPREQQRSVCASVFNRAEELLDRSLSVPGAFTRGIHALMQRGGRDV